MKREELKHAVAAEASMLRMRYAAQLREVQSRLESAEQRPTVSSHDAHNLATSVIELGRLAGEFEQNAKLQRALDA